MFYLAVFGHVAIAGEMTLYNSSLFQELLHKLTKPTADWGPALPKFRTGRYSPGRNSQGDIWNSGISPKFTTSDRVISPSTVMLESYITSTQM